MRTLVQNPFSTTFLLAVLLTVAALATGCTSSSTPLPSSAEARIVVACTQTGMFESIDGRVATAIKEARIPVAVVNAGLDRICANPALIVQDAATVATVIKALATVRPAS